MSCNQFTSICLLVLRVLSFSVLFSARPGVYQIAEPSKKMQAGQPGQDENHGEHEPHQHHHLHMTLGGEKCEPKFTYEEGPLGPSHWAGLCNSGKMQAPIDIRHAEKLRIYDLKFNYQPADLDIVNDCNQYRILVKFPDNYWLTVGKKPYFLSEIHFREPGENAVNGKRPRMAIQLVHFSPEGVFLVIEVPIVAGKENPVVKTLWKNIPAPGKENRVESVKINPTDLLPADRSFYKFPGSLTTPICNEVATWYVMKNPIELSEDQIAEYIRHYHNTARPLQPLNDRPVSERQ
jgi:carbonic anhydrase